MSSIDKVTEMLTALNERVTKLEERIAHLEEGMAAEGVYLDGSPQYVREFVNNEKGGER